MIAEGDLLVAVKVPLRGRAHLAELLGPPRMPIILSLVRDGKRIDRMVISDEDGKIGIIYNNTESGPLTYKRAVPPSVDYGIKDADILTHVTLPVYSHEGWQAAFCSKHVPEQSMVDFIVVRNIRVE